MLDFLAKLKSATPAWLLGAVSFFLAKLKDGKSAWLLGAVSLGVGLCLGVIAARLFRIDFGQWMTFSYWIGDSTTTSRSEVFRNIGLAVVAGFGLILAIVRAVQIDWQTRIADKQKALTERQQITERFSRAVEHLGNEYITVRLGGVYALWRLIDEISEQDGSTQEKDISMIVDALTAFVRGYDKSGRRKNTKNNDNRNLIIIDTLTAVVRGHYKSDRKKSAKNNDSESQTGKDEQSVLRYDIETIIKLLGEEKASYRPFLGKPRINLARANLQFGVFGGIDISGAIAAQANISDCNLVNANLSNARMACVDLSRSTMLNANCTNTNFSRGRLIGAKFFSAQLKDADFEDADISGADFWNAKGLTQEQISSAVCEIDNPPKNLPGNLQKPPRAPQDIGDMSELFQNSYDSE